MNTPLRQRPLDVGPLRAFEAVARLLSFRAAAEELHLTQSAISRQIQSLESDVGAPLFTRGTRHVAITSAGTVLLQAAKPALARLDAGVRQIRSTRGRRVVNVATFASFASMWLIPRMEAFQREHADIDIRIAAGDQLIPLDDPELDIALRYTIGTNLPAGAERLFGEVLTPAISPWLAARGESGEGPPLRTVADLAGHTLMEEDDHRPGADFLSWRHWLSTHGAPGLEPRRWLYLNFTYQQVQAALTAQGVALARLALVADALARGELREPFGPEGRIASPYAYWLVMGTSAAVAPRPEVAQFAAWVLSQAAVTREAMGEGTGAA